MRETIVINTGPIITLAKIEALVIVARLPLEFICPEEVWKEIEAGHRAGHVVIETPWISVRSLKHALNPLALAALDRGEAAVIQLALEQGISTVCIDEWKGRRAASAAGLKITGVLGLLGMAKVRGLLPAVAPYIRAANAAGIRYDASLVDRVLKSLGE